MWRQILSSDLDCEHYFLCIGKLDIFFGFVTLNQEEREACVDKIKYFCVLGNE